MIDISGWKLDEQFSPYPEGSRDKYAVISPEIPDVEGIVPGHRYLMKFSNPRYPVQFWSELIAGLVGKHMGVRVPRCFLAIDPSTGAPGSLISWFYGEGAEDDFAFLPTDIEPIIGPQTGDSIAPDHAPSSHSRYVPGSAYMVRYIAYYDLTKGIQHNVETLSRFLAHLRYKYKIDYWPHWISVFTFDALIGNTDRHQDNWGVLWRTNNQNQMIPRFSPAFDNGTSLLHEIVEDNISNFEQQSARDAYIRRGRHHIRLNLEQEKGAHHIPMIEHLIETRPHLAPFVTSVVDFNFDALAHEIMHLSNINSPVPISPKRCTAICNVLYDRITLLRHLSND